MKNNIDMTFIEQSNSERILKRSLIEAHDLFNNIENFAGEINNLTSDKLEKLSQKIDQLINQYPNYSDTLKEINNQINLFLENKNYLDTEDGATPGKNIEEFKLAKEKKQQFNEVTARIKTLLKEIDSEEIDSENTDLKKSA